MKRLKVGPVEVMASRYHPGAYGTRYGAGLDGNWREGWVLSVGDRRRAYAVGYVVISSRGRRRRR